MIIGGIGCIITAVILLILILALLSSSNSGNAPEIPIWGGSMKYSVTVKMTDISDAPEHPIWMFDYYYFADTIKNATYSRYDMAEGQHDEVCKGIKDAPKEIGAACSVIHSANDNWLYIDFPNDNFCC